jgi:GT2 family glycosyltransferase
MEEPTSYNPLILDQKTLQITEPIITIVIPTLKYEVELPQFLSKNQLILSRSKGRSKGRNDGALKCDSEFILFIDDDASFSKETYNKYVLNVLRKNPDTIVSYESPVLCTRVMAISRDIFFKLGGFDETLVIVEDYDFGYRALENGYHISYIPRDLVHHREHPRLPQGLRFLMTYKNRIRLMMRYKKILLWDNRYKHYFKLPFGLLNCLKMFYNFPKMSLSIPIRLVVYILSFYYYYFFDKTRLIENVS